MTDSNGNVLLAGTVASDTVSGGAGSDPLNGGVGNDTIGGTPARPCAAGPRNEEKQMSDDSQVELSELANRRIAYAAKVAELQYKQAKRICDEINGIPIGIDDPMVLAVLKAISTNYVALGHGAELRICSYPEAAEFDAQTRGSLSVADLVKVVDPSMFDGEIGSPEEVSWATELLVGVRHAGRGSGLSSGSPTKERREQALNLDNKTHRMR